MRNTDEYRLRFLNFGLQVNQEFTVGPYVGLMDDHTITGADIYRSADQLLRLHGRDATTVAEMRATEFLVQGDMDGYRMWKRITLVVDTLYSTYPPEGSKFH